jgi:DNA gyrase subunit A
MATVRKPKAPEPNHFINDAKNVIETSVGEETAKSYMEYSLSVVFSRALVSATDGLKPVARRILFSMYRDGFTPDKNYVKSARTVGNVMASLHPHGDSSIYDAMVKLAQPFYTNVKYIDGYGNWGDVGGSGAAAPRYTEAKLDKNALLMIGELKENTVDMKPNYDGEEEEPTVLPVQFPALVINGTFGLAVGFSSNMAPHNPTEVLDATRWLLTHPNADLDKIMTFIPGPDFPTGGQIIGMDAIREAYETGKGIIRIRATYHVEDLGRGKHNIVFTEMPYGVKTPTIIAKIKDGIKLQKLQGIIDVKDLTDRRNGTRLVVETKAGVNPEALVMDLYKNTPLEDSYGINNVALVKELRNGKLMDVPKTLGLKEQLEIFIAHRVDVVTRRTQHRKDKKDARLHILEGMLKALANIDEVIRIIRAAPDASTAQENLIKKFKLDEIQADYILSIPLRRLTKFDQIELNEEKIRLTDEVKELNKILSDDKELRAVIGEELAAVRKQLDRPRKSVLVGGSLAEHLAEAKKAVSTSSIEIADEPTIISLTSKGGIVRNAKPVRNALSTAATTTRGKFLVVTNKGRAFRIDALHVGEKPAAVGSVLPSALLAGEKCVAVTPVALEDGKTGGIAMGTKAGIVKIQDAKFPLKTDEFSVIALADGDELLGARWVDDIEAYDFVFITSDSSLLTFPANKVRPQGALTAGGVAGIKVADGESIIDFSVVSADEKDKALVVSVSDAGNAKFTPFNLYPSKGRSTSGVRSFKMLKTDSKVVYSTIAVNPVLVTADGTELAALPADNRRDGTGKPLGGVPVRL